MQCIRPWYYEKVDKWLPCQKCNFCIQNKALDWAFRLCWEQKVSYTSKFVTLTYADEYLPIEYATGEGTFSLDDLQKFHKRLRKANEKYRRVNKTPETVPRIRYYQSSEYGGLNGRPHYHLILFNCEPQTIGDLPKIWPIGNVDVGGVTGNSIGYVCGYHLNSIDTYPGRKKPFATMSRKGGIGKNYINSNLKWHKDLDHPDENKFYVLDNGHVRRMPRFYKTKIFTKEEIEESEMTFQQQEEIRAKNLYEAGKYHANPESYYQTMVQYMHDQIAINWKRKKQHL
ncbi:MAG: replication initiator protein [Microvirus sp.]|nr:MAG: replication initiator protein [Microvirus sp.]